MSTLTKPWCTCPAPALQPIYELKILQCTTCSHELEDPPDWHQWWNDIAEFVKAVEVAECIHGLGPVSACTMCNGRDAAEARANEMPAPLSVFAARYPGRCLGCDVPIQVGDIIAWHPDWLARHHDCWKVA